MTTTVLAQKMMSVKLGKVEFEKLKKAGANNMQNMFKVIPSLKQIIDQQVKNKTCRLCLKAGNKRIIAEREDVEAFNYVKAIKNILQIEVRENDDKPQHICLNCEITLKNAEQLKQTAEATQWRLQQELELVKILSQEPNLDDTTRHHGGYFSELGSKVKKEWSCGKCRQTFDSQEAFTAHELLPRCRGNRKCCVCETCGFKFKSSSSLKVHRLIHTGERPFPCAHCPYRGRTRYAVMIHERKHTGMRPVACSHCPATFLSSSNLFTHKKRHMPPMYHCHVCTKSYRYKESLQNHLVTQHSTAKPYICNTCGKLFSTRNVMLRHELKVHKRPKMRPGILPTYLPQHDAT